MSYFILFEKQVTKYLLKLDKIISGRIVDKIKELKESQVPSDAKRVINVKDKVFRLRIGKYRVLYRIEKEELIIIFLIDKRSRVYEK